MLLASVDYFRPDTLTEAVEALGTPGARVLAGGQSLISLLKLRAAQVDLLVDITRLEELRGIEVLDDGSVRIGAGVTYDDMATSQSLADSHPKLSDVASFTVDAQVRNRGTFGGNLCHNDPINNFPPMVAALDGTMHARGPNGDRDLSAKDFFTGYFANGLEADEILISVTVPPLNGRAMGYQEIEIGEAAARAVAAIGIDDGVISSAQVALGCLPVPTRLPQVEQRLMGAQPSAEVVAEATEDAGEGIQPVADADASAEYRRAMAPVVAKRAVLEAIEQGGGHG